MSTFVEAAANALEPTPTSRGRSRRGTRLILLTAVPLALLALLGVFSPLLPFVDPLTQHLSERLAPPAFLAGGSWQFPLGTDQLGRDILSRIIVGARLTLLVALAAVLVGGALGTLVGLLSGYYRGTVDAVSSRFVDAQLAFLCATHLILRLAVSRTNNVPRIRSISGDHLHPHHG